MVSFEFSTILKLSHLICTLLVCYNLKSLNFLRQLMNYFNYEKSIKLKKFPAH